tara:strand:+ start:2213 stop:2515 length:303 start_codon:yes stop_codon:yes gene_type:complete
MRLIFKRRGLLFDISKDEVVRVINVDESFGIDSSKFLVRLLDGQPTFILEPLRVIESINKQLSYGNWKVPKYLLLVRRDGDVCKALMVDSMDWNLKRENI